MPCTCREVAFCENACGLPPAFVYVRAQPCCVLHCGVCYPRVTLICQVTPIRCTSTLRSRTRLRYFTSPPCSLGSIRIFLFVPYFLPIVLNRERFTVLCCLLAFRAIFIRITCILQKCLTLINILNCPMDFSC